MLQLQQLVRNNGDDYNDEGSAQTFFSTACCKQSSVVAITECTITRGQQIHFSIAMRPGNHRIGPIVPRNEHIAVVVKRF